MFGLLAGAMTHFVAGAPILIEAVAGLALLGAFGAALHNALAKATEREAALVTFLVAASGVGFYGIGGAFWGLVAGARGARASPAPALQRLHRQAGHREQHLRAALGGDVGRRHIAARPRRRRRRRRRGRRQPRRICKRFARA